MKTTHKSNLNSTQRACAGSGLAVPVAPADATTLFKFSSVGLACCMVIALSNTASAAPLIFSQIPAGNGSRQPAPNVIISVDDSGSMLWDVTTDNTTSIVANRKITKLKEALIKQFGDGTANSGKVPDGRIRLAWQAMHDNGNSIASNGAKTIKLGAKNSMKSFEGTHRTNFKAFIDSLTANNGTPSHDMMISAFKYMNAPKNIDSPWADKPGTAQTTPYMACRRTYHVFMTDGAWNSQSDTDRVAKGDGTTQTLPDGTVYDKNSAQTKLYSDPYGENDTAHASTLADYAFRGWATDLQNGAAGTSQKNSAGTTISGNTESMPNGALGVKELMRVEADEKVFVGTGSAPTTCNAANKCTLLQPYWNPKNDPATWQHINQYTIGFGGGATTWPGAPLWDSVTNDNYSQTSDYPKLVNGGLSAPNGVRWPNVETDSGSTPDIRTVELWHMALNGRGRFYPAVDADALDAAFESIMETVVSDTDSTLVSIAASTSYLRSGLNAYLAGYDPVRYSGMMSARPIDGSTGTIGATEAWNAATKLDAITVSNRVVLSYSGTAGIPWKTYSVLPAAHQTPMNKNSLGTVDNKGQDRVNYIRGDRTKEVNQSGGIFRQRDSRLGDIVNSNIWYTGAPASGYTANNYATFRGTGTGGKGGRTPMLYVGANDGMLHGFAAADWPPSPATKTIDGGQELIAYIPQGIAQGDLRKLSDTTYTHQYFVDGTPFTGDAFIGSTPAWETVLVGGLGAGGKGYFVLKVTDPSQFSDANAASLVITDTTATTDPDIGAVMSPALMDDTFTNKSRQIVKMNNGRWAVIMGNGYNSTNEAPVLIVQYLDGTKGIVKVSPCAFPTSGTCSFKGTNGLSTPQAIDLDGNGTVDVAYAGDLKGNVWKFNLTSATDSAWSTAFSGQPFFVAKQGGVTQSITAAPFYKAHPLGGIMLAVGTGQNLTDADRATTGTETIYGLWDNSTFTSTSGVVTLTDTTAINTTASTALPTSLVEQTITATATTDAGSNYFASSNNPVDYKGNPNALPTPIPGKRGWYMNWAISGQRVVQNMRAFSGEKFMVQSMTPKTGGNSSIETCSPSPNNERAFQTVLNLFTGAPPAQATFTFKDKDSDGNLVITPTEALTLATIEGVAGDTSLIYTEDDAKLLSSSCKVGQACKPKDFNTGKFIGMRAGWRTVQ